MSRQEILDLITQFRQERQDEFGIVRIGIFGSTARDTFSSDSDVDVVVELYEPDLFKLVGIKQELETLLERPVDIVRYREHMNRFLKERIEEEALYA
jgi:predicted nucleotidyltransferase